MSDSVLVIVGEKSGEEHFLSFFPLLKESLPHIRFFGVGGDSMKKEGVELLYHLKDFGSIGFTEVVKKIPFYIKAYFKILREIKSRNCQVAILVDFQEFNYQLAKRLKKRGIEVLYFVAPQAWAWRSYRAEKLGKIVNTLFTILPFEAKWFRDRGVKNVYPVIHPALLTWNRELSNFEKEIDTKRGKKISEIVKEKKINILLLPGSRRSEIRKLLPIFLATIEKLKKEGTLGRQIKIEISVVKADSIPEEFFRSYFSAFHPQIINYFYSSSQLPQALVVADLCIASSGTVTLSCAFFEVPTIVCYQISQLTSIIYTFLVDYLGPISLPNIILQKIVFPELLQENVNPNFIVKIIVGWLTDDGVYEKIREDLINVRGSLSGSPVSPHLEMKKVILEVYGKKD